jgi:serine/threonine protein kinase
VEDGQRSGRGEKSPRSLGTAPRVLGRYRVVAELARGSTSVVYLAIVAGPGGFNKLFALKQLRATLAEDPANVALFLAEARLAGRLSHPNVVSTLEIEEEGTLPYIVMEYLDGQPLFRAVARARMTGAPLPLPMQLAILSGAVEGLSYAHQATGYDGAPLRVVHRDVSPHNVFVTYGGQAKLLDFGIAQTAEGAEPRAASLRGRVAYMSPEQAAGMAVDSRADLFALGVMMWEAVTGQRFWSESSSEGQIVELLASGRVPAARESAMAGAPPDLQYVILNATEPDPADRYESASALMADLSVVLRRMAPANFSMRDVGRRIGDIFADDRARLQAAVDAQLELVQGAPEFSSRPVPRLAAHATPPPPEQYAARRALSEPPPDGMRAVGARVPSVAPLSPPPNSGIAPLRVTGQVLPSAWTDEAGPTSADFPEDAATRADERAAARADERAAVARSTTLPSMPMPVIPPPRAAAARPSDLPIAAGTSVSVAPTTAAVRRGISWLSQWTPQQQPLLAAAVLGGLIAALVLTTLRDRWTDPVQSSRAAAPPQAAFASPQAAPRAAAPVPGPVPLDRGALTNAAAPLPAEPAILSALPPAVTLPPLVPRPAPPIELGASAGLPAGPAAAVRTVDARPFRPAVAPAFRPQVPVAQRMPAPPPAPAPSAAPAPRAASPASTPASTVGSTPVARPSRPIDATNPYAP